MFIILEIQEQEKDSTPNTISYTADTIEEAKSKFHYILHYAAVSELYRHGAILMQTDGKYIERESFEHIPPEPEPESESEPEPEPIEEE